MDTFPLHSAEVKTGRQWGLLKVTTHVGNSKTDKTSQRLGAETMSPFPGCFSGMAIIRVIILMGCGPSTLGLRPLLHTLSPWDMAQGLDTQHLCCPIGSMIHLWHLLSSPGRLDSAGCRV